jgi:hypothetical protein
MHLDSLAIFRISNGINLKGHLLAIKEKSWAQKSKSISAAVIQNPTKPKRPKNGELYIFFSHKSCFKSKEILDSQKPNMDFNQKGLLLHFPQASNAS